MTPRAELVVVGAGIVGLTIAREFLSRHTGAAVTVVEREADVAQHQSGHNSGVIHSGIYYAPGSLKARLCVAGARSLYEYCEHHGIAHQRCGKLIVAVRAEELSRLAEIERRGLANGVPGLRRISRAEIQEVEPSASGLAAVHSPTTGIVDYAEVARKLRSELTGAGVEFQFSTVAKAVRRNGSESLVITSQGEFRAARVIACAGLWSDRLARRSGAAADPRIVPFRGAYLYLRPDTHLRIRGLIYPVPDPELPFLGVHVTKHINGAVSLGPSAMLVLARDAYRVTRVRARDAWETVSWPGTWQVARRFWRVGAHEMQMAARQRAFVEAAAKYLPSLTMGDVDRHTSAGVRAQAVTRDGQLVDDFVIQHDGSVTHVRNAPSPAATASFAIARELLDRVERLG